MCPARAGWTLESAAWSRGPLKLTLDDLKRLPERTLRVTMECAGNGRATMRPRWPAQPWHYEAVGTAEWTGTPLEPLLERAGLADGVRDIVFHGADRGFDAGVEHNYGRSLTPAQALRDDVLLVWAMNGAPLLPQHGFPLRLVVPGWYGMASVKWLERIEAIDRPFDGHQQAHAYTYRQRPSEPGMPVTTMRVKSLMVPPGMPGLVHAASPGGARAGRSVRACVVGRRRAGREGGGGRRRGLARGGARPGGGPLRLARLALRLARGARRARADVPRHRRQRRRAAGRAALSTFGGLGNNAAQRVLVTVR